MDSGFIGMVLNDAIKSTARTIGWLFWIAVIAVAGLVILGVYDIVKWVRKTDKYESKTLLVPTIKLHTDGKVVDTIYVYKIK